MISTTVHKSCGRIVNGLWYKDVLTKISLLAQVMHMANELVNNDLDGNCGKSLRNPTTRLDLSSDFSSSSSLVDKQSAMRERVKAKPKTAKKPAKHHRAYRPLIWKECLHCKVAFPTTDDRTRYCSDRHRLLATYARWKNNRPEVLRDMPMTPKELITSAKTPGEAEFWGMVAGSGDGCWPWGGHCTQQGYGMFCYGGLRYATHRFAFISFYGKEIKSQILHICNTRMCCNPSHLYQGNHQDNMEDKVVSRRTRTRVQDKPTGI